MATLSGARGTGNITAALRKPDVASTVAELEPESTPLTVLTNRLPKKKTVNPKFTWWEDQLEPRFDAVNNGAGYASGDTSIVVDNGPYFAVDYLALVTRTSELIRVTAVSTNTLTVVRGVGSTAAAIVDNDELLITGVAQQEGATSLVARSSNPTEKLNYTQIERTPYESTGTLIHSDQVVSPNDWDRQAKHAGIEHAKNLEYDYLFGRPSENTGGTHPRRTTGGALSFITTNQTDAAGALTEAEFFGGLRPAFRYGSRTKLALAASLPVDVLNGFPRGKLQIEQGESTYGLRVMTYLSPHGTLRVVTHPLLEGSKYGGYIIILDLDQVAKRFLANEKGSRDTHPRENIQENDRDGRKDELLTESGLQFGQEKQHALITGITS